MSDSVSATEGRLRNWKEGVLHFNAGRYWHAHESWERGWLRLPEIEKLHIQSLIQVAGVLYLIEKQRSQAAQSLAKLALQKIERVRDLGGIEELYPRVVIHGLEAALLKLSTSQDPGILLRAELLLSRP